MNREHWRQLKALFCAAIELPPAERAEFVERASLEHPEIREQLVALITSHTDAPDFLEQPAVANASGDADPEPPGDDPDGPGPFSPGDILDQTYDVEALLGQGGMGVVYRVRHRGLARSFAAKLIHSRFADDPVFLDRFSREAEALGKLRHPNVVDVTDFGVDRQAGSHPYLIMELLDGLTLQDRLRSGPLEPDLALPIFDAVAGAIDHAHAQGVLHLDLKPGNVLLIDGPDQTPVPKVLDFGLAQFVAAEVAEPDRARAAQPVGTPAYMAPELWRGQRPGRSADVYSLGVVMFEALTGRRPFDGPAAELASVQRRSATPPASSSNPALSREVDAALAAVLSGDPASRPATARDAVALLRQAVLVSRRNRWRRSEWPRRIAAMILIAVAGTSISPTLGRLSFLQRLEGQAVDGRFALIPKRAPGPNILLLVVDDASLDATQTTPLPEMADAFGIGLQGVFDAGARAVALDFALPRWWSHSVPFSQLVLHHEARLTLGALSTDTGVVGSEAIAGVTAAELGPQRAAALFGFMNLDQDADAVHRRARLSYRDREGAMRASFPGRVAATAGAMSGLPEGSDSQAFWIDHSVDDRLFERVAWKDLETVLRSQPERFRDRVVLVGGDYAGSGDERRVPGRRVIAGVALQALIVETVFSSFPIRDLGRTQTVALLLAGCVLVSGAALLMRSSSRALVTASLAAALYVGWALLAFRYAGIVVPLTVVLSVWSLGFALAWWFRLKRPPFPSI